jgi:glycosyltransferase involved in cell wall biosynthesis
MKDLAVIIPAYKLEYLDMTLNSLACQTCKDFTVYIGDDNSPFDLYPVVEKYKNILNISYTKFDNNIGAKNLVSQWERCVNLSKGETWIWLFSDDDIADNRCVEAFYATLELKNGRFDVYRFNVTVIDNNGNIIRETAIGPEEEGSEEMAYHLLYTNRGNSMPDHIFSRNIYLKCGGFVNTDYAQGADWAISILFSKEKGMCIIQGPNIYWRYSGSNISSVASKDRDATMKGHLQFLRWVLQHFEYLKEEPSVISYTQISEAVYFNLNAVILHHYRGFNLKSFPALVMFLHNKLKYSFVTAISELLKIKIDTDATLEKIWNLYKSVRRKLL